MAQENTGNSTYKSIIKATSLFGGVQVFDIIIRIIRSKVVAVLLGPEGMGIVGLMRSTIELISNVTGCGLRQSAVKNVAEANATGEEEQISKVIFVLRRLVWITGLAGTLLCAVFSPYISQITFGNKDFTFSFILVSVSVLLLQLTAGQSALLQGLQKYKNLAKAQVYGSVIGLAVTVPLYYFWGVRAIVPVMLSTYVIGFGCAYFQSRQIEIRRVSLEKSEQNAISKDMLKVGLLLSSQGILSQVTAYIVRIYISQTGSIADVGLYNAGFAIVNTYIGMLFTAMSTDYFPRLTKAARNVDEYKNTISQQVELVILILLPLIVAFLVFIKPVVILLYSSKFLPVEGMIYWAIAATLVKTLAWALSYGLIAKGEMKAFSVCEFSVIIYGFLLNILGYKLWGLTGLGISFFVMYLLYFAHLFITFRRLNHFVYPIIVWKLFGIASVTIASIILIKLLVPTFISYIVGSVVLILSLIFSYREINNRIQIDAFIKRIFKK